jgi:hypothetical protein
VRAREHDAEREVGDVKRVEGARRDHVGVLRGRLPLDATAGPGGGRPTLRRVDEIRELLRLVDRGLLSDEEFDRQMLTMYGLPPQRRADRGS